ncbi:porin [Flavihumibacter rivuli]|uniref:porin n=1 Tax=Flavihumibacter rivuli TaxID=2838156 RepID=UPI001BDF1F94|nr:porin [Flavihumibacter rivuli]ULQ55096.1 porin [Flavihumibacter rivuli]
MEKHNHIYILSSLLFIALALLTDRLQAQEEVKPAFSVSGYVEVYYGFDFNKPLDGNRPGFVYSHNRHNEVNVNLAFLKGSYTAEKFRANLALAAGTYMNANYAAEPGVLKNLYEANVGVKLGRKANLWLDAGIFASHIGFESAVSKDCWAHTRSIMADNSPYYEAGAKLTFTNPNEKVVVSALLLNGWQRVKRVEGNSTPAFGTQLTLKPNSRVTFNWSTFIGNDKPDSLRRMRYFNNLYAIYQATEKFGLTAGFDFGFEQEAKGSSEMNNWYTPVLIARFTPNDKWAVAARAEYYDDENGVIIATNNAEGFKTQGYSLSVGYQPVQQVVLRAEGKVYKSKGDIFQRGDGSTTSTSPLLTFSIAATF